MPARQPCPASGALCRPPSGRYQASHVGPDGRRQLAPMTFETEAQAEAWLAGRRLGRGRTGPYRRDALRSRAPGCSRWRRSQRLAAASAPSADCPPGATRPPTSAPMAAVTGAVDVRHQRRRRRLAGRPAHRHRPGRMAPPGPVRQADDFARTPRPGWPPPAHAPDPSRVPEAARRPFAPHLRRRLLEDITPPMVRAWFAGLATGPTRKAHAYSLLRTILATAVADDVIAANPCRIRGAGTTRRPAPSARPRSPSSPPSSRRCPPRTRSPC